MLGELSAAAEPLGLEMVSLPSVPDLDSFILQRISRGQKLFIAAGGDGSINHVIQKLVGSEATLGVIPLGTYNHFARDAGIPLDWREALEVAVNGRTRQVDTATVNGRHFLNNISLGLYPEAVTRREEKGRNFPKWKAIPYAAWTTFRKFPHVSIILEMQHHAEALRTHMLMVSNNAYDLSNVGMEATRSSLENGTLAVYWLPHMPKLKFILAMAQYFGGKVNEIGGFRNVRTRSLKIQARSTLRVGIDGEVIHLEPPLVIRTVPMSLLVRVPRKSGE